MRIIEVFLFLLSGLGAIALYKRTRRRAKPLRIIGTAVLALVAFWLGINLVIWLLARTRGVRLPGLWSVYWPLGVLVLLGVLAYVAYKAFVHKSGRYIVWAALAVVAMVVCLPLSTGVSNLVSAVAASHIATANQAAATLSWTKYANSSSSAEQACANRVTGTSLTDAKAYAFTESQHAATPTELRIIVVVDGKDAKPAAITTDDEARTAAKEQGVPNVTTATGVRYYKSVWTYGPDCKRVVVKTPLVTVVLGIPTTQDGTKLKPNEGILPTMWPFLKKS